MTKRFTQNFLYHATSQQRVLHEPMVFCSNYATQIVKKINLNLILIKHVPPTREKKRKKN